MLLNHMIFITMILMTCIFMSVFPLMSSSISLGGLLIFVSLCFVALISLVSSSWYGYLLFLVYIGGLLVLFIYMCMISSNTVFKVEIPQMVVMFLLCFYFSQSFFEIPSFFLGGSSYDSGTMMNMSVFMSLVVILLMVFLAVVQIVKLKSSLKIESK